MQEFNEDKELAFLNNEILSKPGHYFQQENN